MNEIIIVSLPPANGEVKGCWYNGYPIHKGESEDSLNYATVYANEHKIIPDQAVIQSDYKNFVATLEKTGFKIHILPFPEELNQIDNLKHDAIFIRDSGFMFQDYWIKARFSAKQRAQEAEVFADIISKKFSKKIIELPTNAYLEFGETFYLKTKNGTFYFGGLSRSNKIGHDFIKEILDPDHYCLIESEGYHLDTVFSPVINKNNELVAILTTDNMISPSCIANMKNVDLEIINIDPIDSSGVGKGLGNYAVNSLIAPGKLLNSIEFKTPGVEERLQQLGIERYISPLTYHRFAGGSFHCLTNEIYI